MRKAVGILVSGLVLLLLLYTFAPGFLQEPSEESREATVQSEEDTVVVEDDGRTSDLEAPDTTHADAEPRAALGSNRTEALTEETDEPAAPPLPTSRLEGTARLSPMPPLPLEEPRTIPRLGLGAEEPALLSLFARTSEAGASTSDRLQIPVPDRGIFSKTVARSHPSTTVNTPTAHGPGWKQVYAGVGYQNRIRYDDWQDGVATVGAGFGNPKQFVGLDVRLNILDTYTDIAEDRSVSVKLHRRLPSHSAVAVGYENIWHTEGTDGGSSRYAVASKVLFLRDRPTVPLGSMVVHLGLGTDRFLPEQQFARGEEGINAFGGLALRVHPRLNAIANWTGQDLALGLSFAPFESWPVVVTPSLVDVTGRAGDGVRFSVSASLGVDFGR